MPRRLVAGQRTLDPLTEVRILAGQPVEMAGGDVPEWFRERSAKPRTRVRFPSSPPHFDHEQGSDPNRGESGLVRGIAAASVCSPSPPVEPAHSAHHDHDDRREDGGREPHPRISHGTPAGSVLVPNRTASDRSGETTARPAARVATRGVGVAAKPGQTGLLSQRGDGCVGTAAASVRDDARRCPDQDPSRSPANASGGASLT